MTSAGSPEQAGKPAKRSHFKRPAVLAVIGAVIVAALVLGLPAIRTLYAIVNPPMPPIPPAAVEVEYNAQAHGVDDWLYVVDSDACDVVAFLRQEGGTCINTVCTGNAEADAPITAPNQAAGQCEGRIDFLDFTLRWQAIVSSGEARGPQAYLRMTREVFWGGQIPPSMEEIIEDIERGG